MSFIGVKLIDLAKSIHDNPEGFYPLILKKDLIGAPRDKEKLCREILIELGYTLSEINHLHDCNFNRELFKKLPKGPTKETIEKMSKTRFKEKSLSHSSSPSIPIRTSSSKERGHFVYPPFNGLSSYVPPTVLDSKENPRDRLTKSLPVLDDLDYHDEGSSSNRLDNHDNEEARGKDEKNSLKSKTSNEASHASVASKKEKKHNESDEEALFLFEE